MAWRKSFEKTWVMNKITSSDGTPVRILFLVHSLRRGGAERVLLEIALGLRAKGHVVEVAAWLDVDEYREECYRSVPRHFLIRGDEYRWPWSVPHGAQRLRELAGEFLPEVIEIHTPTLAWVAAWANLGVPTVHVVQGYGAITRSGSWKDWLMKKGDRLAHRVLRAGFIVPAPPMAEVAADHFAVPRSRFSCVPNGVDVSSFTPDVTLPDDAPSIMMLGTLSPHKGQQWGVHAVAALVKQLPKARLSIVGDGPNRAGLERLIEELGVAGNARLLGRVKEAFEMMAASQVLWHLSESEGLPMVVLEAMASGVPVIGFDVRGTRDVVVDGETGYLVPYGDVALVVQRTIELLSDGARYQEIARKARARAAGIFSMECMVDGHESVLTQAALGRSQRVPVALPEVVTDKLSKGSR